MSGHIENLPGMVGRHPTMLELYEQVRLMAPTGLSVFIVGESGTGKELVARAIHQLSETCGGAFIPVNCAAIPEALAEAELFGAERGAYTGALRRTDGLLDLAHQGTLFLDEVCSMPLSVQAKLLRAVETREFRRLGGREARQATIRVVSAASEDVADLVDDGRLRSDLAFRLSGVVIRLPPLRERRADVVELIHYFLGSNGNNGRTISDGALRALEEYEWPGNVRELRNVAERLVAYSRGRTIDLGLVGVALDGVRGRRLSSARVASALRATDGSVRGAARILGVPRTTLQRWMVAHNPTQARDS